MSTTNPGRELAKETRTDAPVWDYAAAPERAAVEIADRYGLFINGRFAAPKSRKYFSSINPADESVLCEVAEV